MNDRTQGLIEQLTAEEEVAKLRAFVYEAVASSEAARSFAMVCKQSVPAAFEQFAKRVLGAGYLLVSAVKVHENASAELLAIPFSRQGTLKLWDDETLDRVRELTERRGFGERLLLRCAPLAYDLATQLLQEMSAEAFLAALPQDRDEAFVVRCLLDVFTAHTSFSAGLTQLVPFELLAPPPSVVTSGAKEDAKGWIVRDMCTRGVVTLATGTKGRRYKFDCTDPHLLAEVFHAWKSKSTVAVSFARNYPVGLKQPARYGVLHDAEIIGPSLICVEQERTSPTVTPPARRAPSSSVRQAGR